MAISTYLAVHGCIIERSSTLTLKYGWEYVYTATGDVFTLTHILALVHASSLLDDHQSAPYSPRIIRVCCTHQRSRLIQSP
jgi:hypothetical protein